MATMPMNMAENGPAVPLGEPRDRNPVTLADAAEQFVGHVRRALMDGASPEEMRILGATFKSVEIMVRSAQAAAGPVAGAEAGAPAAGPSDQVSDYGSGQGTPMEGA